jgi:hypothetical protein
MDAWADLIGLGTGAVGYACECGNEPSGSIKCGEFLEGLCVME